MKIDLPERKCKRCGHNWFLKKPEEPIVCPKCKSPYWNKDKKTKQGDTNEKTKRNKRTNREVKKTSSN